MSNFIPMKAPRELPDNYPAYWSSIKYPQLVSPKLDGIRGVNHSGTFLSNTNKPLPNRHLQRKWTGISGMDGELIVGDPSASDVYNRTQSVVMSRDKLVDDLRFYIFDRISVDLPYHQRLDQIKALHSDREDGVFVLPQIVVNNREELEEMEAQILSQGFEGVMIRSLHGRYKHGRATIRENIIRKLKRMQDLELPVVGFVEAQENLNTPFMNEMGLQSRSRHQENKVGKNMLGAFLVEWEGQTISVAPGMFSHAERKHIWENQAFFLRHKLMIRHFPIGAKDLLRQPRAIGWRNENE